MTQVRLSRLTWIVAALAAVAVMSLSLTLIGDGLLERVRLAEEKERVDALEVRVLVEAAAAEELSRELEIQTQRSVARGLRNRSLGWALLVSTIVFLISAKTHQAIHAGPLPTLVTIGSSGVGDQARQAATERRVVAMPPPAQPALDLQTIDAIVEKTGRNREAAIPILQAVQNHYRYLPEEALQRVCERTEIAPAQIIGVASFYSQFRRDPVGRYLVRVCHGTACHVAGIGPIMDELRRQLQIPPGADTDPERRFTIESVNCLGCCSLAPVMMVEDHVAGHLSPTSAWQELEVAEAQS